jgi:hypothetical protein
MSRRPAEHHPSSKGERFMMARKLTITFVALQLAGCASLTAGDPAVYQGLAESDVTLASRLVQTTLESSPDGTTRR